jgi:hypothetical protein
MGPSSLVISNSPVSAPPSAPLPPDGTLAFTQIFTHNNNPINNPAVALDLVTVRTTLQLSWAVPPNPGPGAIGPVSADFTVNFLETINQPASGMCVDGTPAPAAGCPDIFVLTGNLNAFDFFDAEGNHYFVSIVPTPPVALQTLNPAFCTAAGAAPVCQGFVTPEGQATEQQFAFLITLQPLVIPEPGSLALVGMVLLALAVVRRRRRA